MTSTVYNFIKSFAHKQLPFLIYPYRWIKSQCIYLGWLPDQLHDIKQIKRCDYDLRAHDAQYWDIFKLKDYYSLNSPKSDVSGVVCMLDGRMCHGGPTDRLRGILTIYNETKKYGYPFYIHWVYPFRLEDYLVPNKVQWVIKDEDVSYNSQTSYPVGIPIGIGPQSKLVSKLRFKAAMTNDAKQKHIYSNEFFCSRHYRSLFHELFKPSPLVQNEVDKHLKQLGKHYYAYTFRFLALLGDFIEHDNTQLPESEVQAFIEKNLAKLKELLSDVPVIYKVLVTSDSKRFLNAVVSLDPRIYVVPGDVQNIDMVAKENRGAWLKTFVDQQLLINAEKVFLLRTGRMYKSGFPRFAALVGNGKFKDIKF